MTIFTARANYWQRNLEDSQKINALSCRRTKEDGTIVPGVALFSGSSHLSVESCSRVDLGASACPSEAPGQNT